MVSVHRRAEEMRTGVDARCVDVKVLGEVAHLERFIEPILDLCDQLVCPRDMLGGEDLQESVGICGARQQRNKIMVESEDEKQMSRCVGEVVMINSEKQKRCVKSDTTPAWSGLYKRRGEEHHQRQGIS